LNGIRLSNNNQGISHKEAFQWIQHAQHPLQHWTEITSQTICPLQSNFRSATAVKDSQDGDDDDENWYFRLMYLSIYHLFHAPAFPEMQDRQRHFETGHSSEDILSSTLDYECRDAKFLVTPFSNGGPGLGATIRNHVAATILDAIAVGRIPILLNNVAYPNVHEVLQKPSLLFSCPRGDMQCLLLPLSPCTVTLQEIQNVVPKSSSPKDMVQYLEDPQINAERIWLIPERLLVAYQSRSILNPLVTYAQQNLYKTALDLIQEYNQSAGMKPDEMQILQRAAQKIFKELPKSSFQPRLNFAYFNENFDLLHVAILYALRPNLVASKKIHTISGEMIPPDKRHLGLMIRGTDKCIREATCLTADQYQNLILDLVSTMGIEDVILSTEDQRLLHNITAMKDINFLYYKNDAIITNGDAAEWKRLKVQADRVLLSSLVILHLQLHSSHVVANCCSNFHTLLIDLYKHGCGVGTQHMCLQRHANPAYRICCLFERSGICKIKGLELRNREMKLKKGVDEKSTQGARQALLSKAQQKS
jgi:hypothetical protein